MSIFGKTLTDGLFAALTHKPAEPKKTNVKARRVPDEVAAHVVATRLTGSEYTALGDTARARGVTPGQMLRIWVQLASEGILRGVNARPRTIVEALEDQEHGDLSLVERAISSLVMRGNRSALTRIAEIAIEARGGEEPEEAAPAPAPDASPATFDAVVDELVTTGNVDALRTMAETLSDALEVALRRAPREDESDTPTSLFVRVKQAARAPGGHGLEVGRVVQVAARAIAHKGDGKPHQHTVGVFVRVPGRRDALLLNDEFDVATHPDLEPVEADDAPAAKSGPRPVEQLELATPANVNADLLAVLGSLPGVPSTCREPAPWDGTPPTPLELLRVIVKKPQRHDTLCRRWPTVRGEWVSEILAQLSKVAFVRTERGSRLWRATEEGIAATKLAAAVRTRQLPGVDVGPAVPCYDVLHRS